MRQAKTASVATGSPRSGEPEIDIAVEIGSLAGLDLATLRERWHVLYESEPPPRTSRELMIRAIAYRIQENRYGALSPATRTRLLSRSGAERNKPIRARKDRSVKSGTRFLREWNGRTHEVSATADGRYAYGDSTYRSLSAIARKITGTRWSGPAFFGLNTARRKTDAVG